LGTLGYNQVAELLVSGERSTDLCILENFLHSSASQLTVYGLFQLHSTLSDGQLAVLFRNNHFNTLYKNKDELYVLVTDQGFINEPSVVWETLNSVDGSSTFVNASFSKSKPTNANEDSELVLKANNCVIWNHLLALALQQEENNKQEQNINTATGTSKTKKSSSSLSLHSKSGSTPAQTPSSTASSSKHSTKSSKLDEVRHQI
uniref:Ubiquitin carboxyl-terminal hydrolase n=1 Tax=Anisakis simplex TaxID=6269 RepID=A0A0M3KG49_ANISI